MLETPQQKPSDTSSANSPSLCHVRMSKEHEASIGWCLHQPGNKVAVGAQLFATRRPVLVALSVRVLAR